MRQKLLAALVAALTLLPVAATAQGTTWTDITYLLKNPSFETDKAEGWTVTKDAKDNTYKAARSTINNASGTQTRFYASDGNYLYYMYSNYNVEEVVSHSIRQTVKLPAGNYQISADIAVRSLSSNCFVDMTASATTSKVTVNHVEYNEKFNNYTLNFTVAQTQDVTIGFCLTLTGRTSPDHDSYCALDKVKLKAEGTEEEVAPSIRVLQNAQLLTDIFGANYTATTPYNVIMNQPYALHEVHNNAITCQPGNPKEGTYEHKFTDKPGQTHRGQAFFFEPVETSQYVGRFIMSYTNHEGGTNYICTAKTGYGSSKPVENLRATTDKSKALKIRIEKYLTYIRFHNTEANDALMGGRDEGFYTADDYRNLIIQPAATVSVPVEIAAGGYATRIFPFAPAAIEGVEYYSCTGVNADNELTLALVATPRANKPYILHATGAAVSETLTGYATARDDSYAEEQLTGVYTTAAAPTGSYVLQTIDGKQAFYLVTEADPISMPANRCYLTVPATGVKAFKFPTATGLTSTRAPRATTVIYDLSGRRLTRLTKGVNIVNGKKIVK